MSIITWMASPGSGDYNTASNWSPSVAPVNSFDDAFFGTSTITSLSINTGTMIEVGDWIFNRGASQYTTLRLPILDWISTVPESR